MLLLRICTEAIEAYALTIHKTQSLSIRHIVRGCVEGIFAIGQVYVLVSRVTALRWNLQCSLLRWRRARREGEQNITRSGSEDPQNFELIGLPPADLLEEVCAAWHNAGLSVEECLQRCTTVTKEFTYTSGGRGDLRRCFTAKYNHEHTLPVKHRKLGEVLNPMPKAAAVFHRLLDWIDRVDIAAQRGDPRPDFATPEGGPIFPEGENDEKWWLTDQQIRREPPQKASADAVMEDGPPQTDDDAPLADDELQTDDDEQSDDENPVEGGEEHVGDGFGCESQLQADAPQMDYNPDVAWTRPPTLERPLPFYFERQRDAQCGLQALNNAVGKAWQTVEDMKRAADVYLEESSREGSAEARSRHIAPGGWYSSEVMAKAVETTPMHKNNRVEYVVKLQPLHVNPDRIYSSSVVGAFVNVENWHWVALRYVEGKLYLLDSLRGRPIAMSEREYRVYVKKHPHSYCIERAQDMSLSASSASTEHLAPGTSASPLLPFLADSSGEAASANAETDLSKVAPDMEVDGQVGTCTLISVAAATQTRIRITL